MIENLTKITASKTKYGDSGIQLGRASSFKKIRQIRKKSRLKKSLALKNIALHKGIPEKTSIGPTKETAAKLKQDPLVRFKNNNILNDQQIQAFQRIRRAVRIITDGTQVRTSSFNDVVVQTSNFNTLSENEYEIRIKDHYSDWIDRMTAARLAAGPVLDIIIDELSLSAVDRKWGRRKGWAKTHLQSSLDLYFAFFPVNNRHR